MDDGAAQQLGRPGDGRRKSTPLQWAGKRQRQGRLPLCPDRDPEREDWRQGPDSCADHAQRAGHRRRVVDYDNGRVSGSAGAAKSPAGQAAAGVEGGAVIEGSIGLGAD